MARIGGAVRRRLSLRRCVTRRLRPAPLPLTTSDAYGGLRNLYASIGAAFRREAPKLACKAGCSMCCAGGLRVSRLEAAFIRSHVAEQPSLTDGAEQPCDGAADGAAPDGADGAGLEAAAPTAVALRSRFERRGAARPSRSRCAFLAADGSGACTIYAARPAVCRSHGLYLKWTERGSKGVQRGTCVFNLHVYGEVDEGDDDAMHAAYDVDAEYDELRRLHTPGDERAAAPADAPPGRRTLLHAVSLDALHADIRKLRPGRRRPG
ncbi:hypothetical protein M885DRAFT_552448 [Pelagophyceae sp. CCMP2097]|nr:hypothetical protein M885DRAFT_552448 [Pelagophyceae sp. CCMP2097]